MTQIKYYGVNTLPSTAETGAIYLTNSGSLYVGTSANTFKEFTSTLFVETLPTYGEINKVYIHTENGKAKLKVWNNNDYELLSGDTYNDTEIRDLVSSLQGEVDVLENQVVTTNGEVSALTNKVTDLESELDNLDLTTIENNILANTTAITTLQNDIINLESDMDDVDDKLLTLETELTNLDGKVKLNNGDTSAYLESKLDNDTLKIVNSKLVAMKLDGQLSTVAELNFLTGVTSSIQSQIDNLSSVVNVKDEIVDTEADLPTEVDDVGTIILVRSDSTQDNSPTFYRSNGTAWVYVNKINNEIARNFATQPIDLTSEVTGILPKSNYEKQSASETTVEDVNSNFSATNVEGVLEELNSKIENLESAEVEVDLSPIQTQIDGINGEITTIKSNMSTNTSDITTLNGKVSTIESNIETLEDTINNLPTGNSIALNDTVTSTSITEAGTARAVKEAYDKGVEALNKANEVLPTASTIQSGIVQLNSTTSSTSTTQAATASAVKSAYELANTKASTAVYTATISTIWTGTSAPFTQNITVTGMLATDAPFAYPVYSTTNATALLQQETWFKIGKITTGTNTIAVTCFEEKPTTALPIQLRVVR